MEMQRCHICGEMRPPALLSTQRNKRTVPGSNTKVIEEVLYCTDKAECVTSAPKFTFMGGKPTAVMSRRKVAPGQPADPERETTIHETYNEEGVVDADPATSA